MNADRTLRTWGAHWRARLDGNVLESLGIARPEPKMEAGDALKAIEAMKVKHPRLEYDEAVELEKYGQMPRSGHKTPRIPGMADLDRQVSIACKAVGERLWDAYKAETGWSAQGARPPLAPELIVRKVDGEVWGWLRPRLYETPSNDYQGRVMAIEGVRFLVREVYVNRTGTRSRWPGSSFDWLYVYSVEPNQRKGHGRESTINLVKSELDSQRKRPVFEPKENDFQKTGVPLAPFQVQTPYNGS